MRKPSLIAASVVALVLVAAGLAVADEKKAATTGTWKGEIVDIACYVGNHASGGGHSGCAKKCAEAGQPIGLLTGDDLILLAADHDDGKPFEAAKAAAGTVAEVSGELSERNGEKVIAVTGVKPAA